MKKWKSWASATCSKIILAGSIFSSVLCSTVLFSPSVGVSFANNFGEKSKAKQLKATTNKDFTIRDVIPISKFAAKVGGWLLKMGKLKPKF